MHKDIKDWVKSCTVCQTHARVMKSKEGKMAPIVATRPFQIMGMDIVNKLPVTTRGNKAIVVFTDYYTKWVEAYPIEDETAITIAQKLI